MKLQFYVCQTETFILLIIGGRQCYADTISIPLRYYHSDHLGSASWITNGSGTPVQHLQYMPYGEPFVNERTTAYEERFTFTGKERDSETGFSYFGARYYDSDILTGWLSVDPLADKYPNISPYAYCAWNPVKLVDPDGREYGKTYHEITGELIHDDNENDGKVYIGTKSDGSDRRYIAQENDIADMSVPFDKQLSETKYFFEQCSKELDNEYFSSTNTYVVERFKRFHSLVTDGAKFDLKKTSNYSQKDFSRGKGYSFYHGKLFRYDDYGNYNYGVAAKYYGLLKITALLGAGVNQIKKALAGVTGWFPSNFKGFGDDPRDTYMIEQGYKHKFDLE